MILFLKKYTILLLVCLFLLVRLLGFFFSEFMITIDYVSMVGTVLLLCPLVYKMIEELMGGTYGIDLLALVSIVTALVLGEYTTSLIIVLMLSGGAVLEEYAMHRAQEGIDDLAESNPGFAVIIKGNKQELVASDTVSVGSIILVKQNEIIPIDGIIHDGISTVNESKITGESVLVHKQFGDKVYSGSVNIDSAIYIQTTKTSSESSYQNIITLVENAKAIKPKFIRMADRYSVVFTVVAFCICAAVYFFTRNWHTVLLVLVVATPCPLILAAPTAFACGVSLLSRMGIVVQNPDSIERLSNARIFLLDKTGTLTFGTPRLSKIESFDRAYTETDIVQLFYSIERLSPHILSESVCEYANNNAITPLVITNFSEILGQGVRATINGRSVVCGAIGFAGNAELYKHSQLDDCMYVYIAINGGTVGRIAFMDSVRPDTRDFISRLKEISSDVLLVSGDKKNRVDTIAESIGIDHVWAECKPEDKLELVEQCIARNVGSVIMLGDGINDRPALVRSDVGVAIGSGTNTIANSDADMVIVGNNPSVLVDAVLLTQRTMFITKQSIFVGLGLSIVLMVCGAFSLFTPVAGALMQECIDVIVIVNALRVLKYTKQVKPL